MFYFILVGSVRIRMLRVRQEPYVWLSTALPVLIGPEKFIVGIFIE